MGFILYENADNECLEYSTYLRCLFSDIFVRLHRKSILILLVNHIYYTHFQLSGELISSNLNLLDIF